MMNIIGNTLKERKMEVIAQDNSLSSSAIGLLFKIINADINTFSLNVAMSLVNDKESKVKNTLKELESKKYIVRNRERINGKFACYSYVICITSSNNCCDNCDDLFLKSLESEEKNLHDNNSTWLNATTEIVPADEIATRKKSYMVKNKSEIPMENQDFLGYDNTDISYNQDIDMIDNNIKNNNYIYLSNQSYQSSNLDSSADVKSQVCYDTLVSEADSHDKDLIDLMVNIVSEIYNSKSAWTRVSGQSMPTRKVITQFMKLGKDDLLYVIDCMNRTHTKIRSIKPYLVASLYNAAMTQDSRKLTENYNRREKQRQADSYCKRDELYDNFGESSFNIDEWREMAESYDPEKITFA